MNRPRDRRRASGLQRALERYERLLAEGVPADEARAQIAPLLTSPQAQRMFAMASGLREAAERDPVVPSEAFAIRVANLIRAEAPAPAGAQRVRTLAPRRRLALMPLAAAACIAVFAALLVPAMSSLPGDRLYGLKGVSEDTRLLFASGATEARVRLDLAEERFSEVERLIQRSQFSAIGTFAAAPADIADHTTDPRVARLVEAALLEAGAHLEAAAEILTSGGAPRSDLDELVQVTRRGHQLATAVAEDLPNPAQPPVLSTVVKLAKIEAAAKAARTQAEPKPTPPPCDAPTPSPEPTTTPDETATPTAVEATEPPPSPSAEPEATPCVEPSPAPTPEPTEEPATEPTTEPSATPDVQEGVEGSQDSGSGDGVSQDEATSASALQQPA